MRYLFGPVRSRRLGRSLGIDLVPGKLCTYDCIYCEIGVRKARTCRRKHYAPIAAILDEVRDFLATKDEAAVDVLTITASGEPTLHAGLGECIAGLKEIADIPICVLTNGSLLHLPEVRADLASADIVIPSLDAARPAAFAAVNRPASCIDLDQMLAGLVAFREAYSGAIWLEILLVKGVNDADDDIDTLADWIARIRPDRVQLNTVVRPPLESFARPLSSADLQRAAARLGPRVEIIAGPTAADQKSRRQPDHERILAMLARRPCSGEEIGRALGIDAAALAPLLAELTARGTIAVRRHNGIDFYQPVEKRNEHPAGRAQTNKQPCP